MKRKPTGKARANRELARRIAKYLFMPPGRPKGDKLLLIYDGNENTGLWWREDAVADHIEGFLDEEKERKGGTK